MLDLCPLGQSSRPQEDYHLWVSHHDHRWYYSGEYVWCRSTYSRQNHIWYWERYEVMNQYTTERYVC